MNNNELISGSQKNDEDKYYMNSILGPSIPSVHFEGFNTYLPNGEVVTYPSYVYDAIGRVNSKVLLNTLDRVNENNLEYSKHTISGVVGTTVSTVVGGFYASIDSRYKMFVKALNDLLDNSKTNPQADFRFTATEAIKNDDALTKVIDIFLHSDEDTRSEYVNKQLFDFGILMTNSFGTAIYNSIRFQVSIMLMNYDLDAKSVEALHQFITNEFSCMMQDFTFEVCLFVENIKHAGILLPTEEFFEKYITQNKGE